MTLKEFSDKYGIPYRIAYDASYLVKYDQQSPMDRKKYQENDLLRAVLQLLEERIARHRKHLEDLTGIMNKLTES